MLLLGVQQNLFASHFDWVQQIIYSTRGHNPNSMVCDKDGNLFIAGNYYSCIVCPRGFIEKRDSNGTYQWQIYMNNQGMPMAVTKLALDTSGNIYAAIAYSAYNDLNLGGAVIPADGNTNLVAKFSPSGTLIWYKTVSDHGTPSLAVDASSNVYYTDGDTLRKYSPGGVLKWKSPAYGSLVEVNGSDVFVGYSGGIAKLSKNTGVQSASFAITGLKDFIVLSGGAFFTTGTTGTYKYSATGNMLWFNGTIANAIARSNNTIWLLDASVSQFPNNSWPSILTKLNGANGGLLTSEILENACSAGLRNLCVTPSGNVFISLTLPYDRKYSIFTPYLIWPNIGQTSGGFFLAKYLGESTTPVLGFGNSVWDPNTEYNGYWNENEIGNYRPCPGSTSFNVHYVVHSALFQPGNVVRVEMSDVNGDFSNPVVIGAAMTSTPSGAVGCILPLTVPNGAGYKIRLHSTNPDLISYQTSLPLLVSSPKTTLNVTGSSTTFCSGAQSIYASPVNSDYFLNWQRNSTFLSASNDSSLRVFANGTYSCLVYDGMGCSRMSENSLTLRTLPLPNAAITPMGTQEICQGTGILLEVPAVPTNAYVWYKGSAIVGGNTHDYTAATSGTYKVQVTGSNGCTKTSSAVKVTLYKSTLSAFGPTTFCTGDSVLLGANGGAGISYQWLLNGVTIPGAASQYYNALLPGTYTVMTSNSNGCESVSAGITVAVNCRFAEAPSTSISVYPNPVANTLHISFPVPTVNEPVEVFDMNGRMVRSDLLPQGAYEVSIDVSLLDPGMYVVRHNGNAGTFVVAEN